MTQGIWMWIGGALGAVGLAIVFWGMLSDRSCGRPRCPKCWYAMDGATPEHGPRGPAWQCPECGRSITSARALHRTRRRWRPTSAGVVVLLAAVACLWWWRVPSRGYLWPVPIELATALIAIEGDDDGFVGREVRARLGIQAFPDQSFHRTASIEDGARVLRRVVRGVPGARPPSERWQKSYAKFLSSYCFALYSIDHEGNVRAGPDNAADATPLLLSAIEEQRDLPFVFSARSRACWPAGVPITTEVPVRHWWPRDCYEEIEVAWRVSGGASGTWKGSGSMTLDEPLTGDCEIKLTVQVKQRRMPGNAPARVMGTERATLRMTVAGEVDDVIKPIESERLNWIMSRMLEARYQDWLELDYSGVVSTGGHGFDGTAAGVRVELFHDGVLLSTMYARWIIGKDGLTQGRAKHVKDLSTYVREQRGAGVWTARITSEPEEVLASLDATSYWKGTVDIPVVFGPRSFTVTRKTLPPGGPPK